MMMMLESPLEHNRARSHCHKVQQHLLLAATKSMMLLLLLLSSGGLMQKVLPLFSPRYAISIQKSSRVKMILPPNCRGKNNDDDDDEQNNNSDECAR